MDRDFELFAEILGKGMDFLRLSAFDTAHAKWEADDDLLHLVLANEAVKVSEIILLVLAMKCFKALSGDAERIGNGDPDAPRAHVEAEDPGLVLKSHKRIIEGYAPRFPGHVSVSGWPRIPFRGEESGQQNITEVCTTFGDVLSEQSCLVGGHAWESK